MGATFLPPLPDDSLVFTPGAPEFVALVADTLGDVGTALDGFDPVFSAVAQDHASLPGLLSAIRHCFERAHSPFSDLGVNTESLVDSAQADAFTSIKAANDSYDSLFVAAPPPPVVPGAAPPTLNGSPVGHGAAPAILATRDAAGHYSCPRGGVPIRRNDGTVICATIACGRDENPTFHPDGTFFGCVKKLAGGFP